MLNQKKSSSLLSDGNLSLSFSVTKNSTYSLKYISILTVGMIGSALFGYRAYPFKSPPKEMPASTPLFNNTQNEKNSETTSIPHTATQATSSQDQSIKHSTLSAGNKFSETPSGNALNSLLIQRDFVGKDSSLFASTKTYIHEHPDEIFAEIRSNIQKLDNEDQRRFLLQFSSKLNISREQREEFLLEQIHRIPREDQLEEITSTAIDSAVAFDALLRMQNNPARALELARSELDNYRNNPVVLALFLNRYVSQYPEQVKIISKEFPIN